MATTIETLGSEKTESTHFPLLVNRLSASVTNNAEVAMRGVGMKEDAIAAYWKANGHIATELQQVQSYVSKVRAHLPHTVLLPLFTDKRTMHANTASISPTRQRCRS